ncbi:methylase involved in ubiquinone/menaquinone biosynthesis [Candidatus Methanoperedens nitroreducens]|uniref:Methylase involved in ubiquinone/menaquinone biosynthesis n=1 Tax=Candidatus Methanoperedens nitratireducens TaxID=1392998 RepID=A0A062V549_9EURY|nr:class I SAM-dependent methyltransferase [Candidatus Methanoperedens nitroreducens]KCZ70520.1 methylase involved in ubiquinone/menaquinone biosynthesis [Candidatus Methanoperedens nitroreducens]MDJ1420372.1 methyltransferase domain-containing protein [Candidatus Methanoperedens sp.]
MIKNNLKTSILQCIKCNGGLIAEVDAYKCRDCGAIFPIVNDIPMFVEDTKYYGDMPSEEMEILLQRMSNEPWRDVIDEMISNKNPWLYFIMTEETRTDWQFLFSLDKNSLVLEVGAGHGTSTIAMARRAKVIAIDGTYHRLAFLKIRCEQEGVKDVSLAGMNILKNPLCNNLFDLVTLNGVLEWVGASVNERDPEKLQIQALRECHRVLKPGGKLYIGIENSHAFRYLLGAPDDHVGIPHISYLKREDANNLMKKLTGQEYRTYLYDKKGYQELLTNAGFSEEKIEFFYPVEDYKKLRYILPLNNYNISRFFHKYLDANKEELSMEQNVKELELKSLENGDIDSFVSSYIIIAEK